MDKGNYVDGFVLTVPRERRNEYKKLAQEAAEIWKRFGALDYKECRADDMTPQWVTFTFPKMTKAKDGEEVWFSFITYGSKAERNKVNKAVMAYFDKKYPDKKMKDMPFDMKRMAYGGFKVEVEG
jgi:alkaline phosphatase